MTRQELLEAAMRCVTQDRNATHGDPEDNFSVIADYWNTYLKTKEPFGLDAKDVAAMMILMKMSRLVTSPAHADHWTDIAGYAACGGEIATKLQPCNFASPSDAQLEPDLDYRDVQQQIATKLLKRISVTPEEDCFLKRARNGMKLSNEEYRSLMAMYFHSTHND